MSAIGSALSGIQAASSRLEIAAGNIANLYTPGFQARIPVQSSGPTGVEVSISTSSAPANPAASNVDLPTQIVELITAQRTVEANIAAIRTQDDVTRSLLDVLA
jgi:flagellar hook protein FlgE